MLYAAVFFLLALLAAAFGFGGFAIAVAGVAKFLFIAFMAVAVVAFALGNSRQA